MPETKDFEQLLRSNLEHAKLFQNLFDHVQDSQEPNFVTVCCSDSRVMQDHIWGNEEPGQVFTVSNIGNRTYQKTENGESVSGDLLYPVAHTGTENMVVIGHTGCGAVTATYVDIEDGVEEQDGIRHCIDLLKARLEEGVEKLPEGLDNSEAVNYLVEYNVDQQVEFLKNSGDIPEGVNIYGVVYDFQDVYSGSRGQIHVVNINGENSVEKLKDLYPDIQDRVERLWEY